MDNNKDSEPEVNLDEDPLLWLKKQPKDEASKPAEPTVNPQFSDSERHLIDMWAAAIRLSQGPELAAEPETKEVSIESTPVEGTYGPERRSVLSFIIATWKRIGTGFLAIILLWALVSYVPSQYFSIEIGSPESMNIGLISVGLSLLILTVVFIMEIHSFMYWKNWKLEITESEVVISQKRSIIGRIDEGRMSIRRRNVEFVDVKRKWYLSFLNIYNVSFDTPTNEDIAFHGLKYIRNGKHLKELFINK